ncbi:ATP-grasp domain-containing protein [Candidatus Thiosymbion oneisti]|uniref:ATP-grasp domain-containing protein n=1 Tax=Candidatus Thiosymbion oneisti TaxID=589554 RepID=UPI000AE038E0|nr:ATP-grasp domain-containing protein [Candidatus Thiosymbion oneisti]
MRRALSFIEPTPAPARIINHDIMGCTAEGVSGNHLYSGRALGLTEPGDLLQIHPELKSQWTYIRDHYQRIGLSHTEQIIWDVGQDVLSRYPEREVCVFYFGAGEHRVRPDAAWFRAVDFINSKNNFMSVAQRLGVPVPKTLCFAQTPDISDRQLETFPHPCYLKAAVSVSGVGIYRCGDAAELRAAIGRFEPGVPVQLQQEVASNSFLSLQYRVTADGLERLAATEQILDGYAHQGNRFPVPHAPWECVEPMAEWLYREGMKKIFAFDMAVVQEGDNPDYLAIECNPRFTGASYPTAIAHKLGLECWVARVFPTRHRSLAFLPLTDIEYNPHRGEGVILVNWGTILVGKVQFLIAGPEAVQEQLILELERRL